MAAVALLLAAAAACALSANAACPAGTTLVDAFEDKGGALGSRFWYEERVFRRY